MRFTFRAVCPLYGSVEWLENAAGHTTDQFGMNAVAEYCQFVADNTIGVNHDHLFSYRLDMDVDGPGDSFMADRMVRSCFRPIRCARASGLSST